MNPGLVAIERTLRSNQKVVDAIFAVDAAVADASDRGEPWTRVTVPDELSYGEWKLVELVVGFVIYWNMEAGNMATADWSVDCVLTVCESLSHFSREDIEELRESFWAHATPTPKPLASDEESGLNTE